MQSAARTFKCCQDRAAAASPADGVRHHYGKRSAVPAILSCGPEGRWPVIRGGFVNVWQHPGECNRWTWRLDCKGFWLICFTTATDGAKCSSSALLICPRDSGDKDWRCAGGTTIQEARPHRLIASPEKQDRLRRRGLGPELLRTCLQSAV